MMVSVRSLCSGLPVVALAILASGLTGCVSVKKTTMKSASQPEAGAAAECPFSGQARPEDLATTATAQRAAIWVNLINGEPAGFATVLDDLATARVVYLGERHTIDRHHAVQEQVVRELDARGVPLAVGFEQLEYFNQAAVDRYSAGELSFEQLAETIDWGKRWKNYVDYKGIFEAAREVGAPIVALNGRNETIRAVNRGGGVANLSPELRAELPAEMELEDPGYERLLNILMMSHSVANDARLRPMVEAQIARDESMAEHAANFLKGPRGQQDGTTRTLVVICGSGHVNYGLGTVQRLRTRLPETRQRVVVMSISGELDNTPQEGAREIDLTLDHLQALGRPLADYLMIVPAEPGAADAAAAIPAAAKHAPAQGAHEKHGHGKPEHGKPEHGKHGHEKHGQGKHAPGEQAVPEHPKH